MSHPKPSQTKKCDCKYYDDLNDHSATLLKMELPEYETAYNGSGYTICRALLFMGYITVVVLLTYSLWRIHVIESTLLASDRLHNLTWNLAVESNRLHHNRVTRSVPLGHHADVNSIGDEKELPQGSMLTAKNEFVPTKRRRPADEREFEYLVRSLFDKIQTMHNDTDRTHLHSNMKAVFQAWFPVFDALLPEDLVEDQLEPLTGNNRSVNGRVERSVNEEDESVKSEGHKLEKNFSISKRRLNFILTRMRLPTYDDDKQHNSIKGSIGNKSSEMYLEQFSDENEQEIIMPENNTNGKRYSKGKKQRLVRSAADQNNEESHKEKKQNITGMEADKTSEESSEEKKPRTTRSTADKANEESSEEKKKKQNITGMEADKTSEESSEEKKPRINISAANKSSKEFFEEKKQRIERSVSMGSDESKSSSEEEKHRVTYNKNNKSKESPGEKKKDKFKKEKSSEESVESSESAASKEKKKDKEKNELFYQVVPSDQDGSKTIVQVD